MTGTVRAALAALALVLTAIVLAAVTGSDDPYRVNVPLENAAGLEDGSSVEIAGIDRGRVDLRLGEGDRVEAVLELDEGAGPVGRDASARVAAANFLGRKRVELDPGDAGARPAPSGWTIPAARVTMPTDLDQVLGVFDADTRTRAQILLNEAGEAVVGRRVDIRKLLREFPLGLEQASAVLRDLRADDRTMHELVDSSDRFVAEVRRERRALTRMVRTVGETARTVSTHRAQLRGLLAKAPGTLRTLRGFLGDLEVATKDLGPAAREITAAAPPLAATLDEIEPFGEVAGPTLDKATDVAPRLTQLATRATPVLRRARPTVRTLASTAKAMAPVSNTLDRSADNIIAVLENWSRAIQFRDQLGHVFRGEASWSPDLILSAVDRLSAAQRAKERRRAPARTERPAPRPAPLPKLPQQGKELLERLPKIPKLDEALDALGAKPTIEEVQKAVDGVLGGLTGGRSGRDDTDALTPLLDLLLAP